MTSVLHVDQTRAEGTLGASDAACALGCDRYKSPLTLWKELRGLPVETTKPAFVKEAGEWGNALEPIVRGKYALKTNSVVYVPTKSFVIYDWLRTTPDGFAVRNTSPKERARSVEWTGDDIQRTTLGKAVMDGRGGLVQVKTASAYKREEWDECARRSCVPFEYEIQERVEMAVTDMPWADVICLVGGQKLFGPIRVERDEALEDRILTDLGEFWRLVKDGIEPTPDHTEAWRLHAGERLSLLKARMMILDPDDELRAEVAAWRAARRAVKDAKTEVDELKNRLLLKMANAGATGIQLDKDTCVTAYQVGVKPKWKDYAISLGGSEEVPAEYKGTKNSWALRAPDEEPHDE